MDIKNPYQLNEGKYKGCPDKTYQRVPLTEEEKLEKLKGYVIVPKEFWPFVKYSTHVRYVETARKGGEFRNGGFVLNNPFDTKVKGGDIEKRFIKFQNNFNKSTHDHKEWIIAYEDIAYLYVKGTGVELTLQQNLQNAVTTLNENINKLAEYAKKIDKKISQ